MAPLNGSITPQQQEQTQDLENEIVDVESEPAETEGLDQDLPMAMPKQVSIEENKEMDRGVLHQLMTHVIKAQPSAAGAKYPCDFCRATDTFKTKAGLLSHIINEHPFRQAMGRIVLAQ